MEQVRRGVEAHRRHFGEVPRGLWPSEGAVCPEMLPILERHGIRWFATDEAILARSLGVKINRDPAGHLNNPRFLYQPYTVSVETGRTAASPGSGGDQPMAAIFRDHTLSDRIGFVYQGMPGQDAAEDLIGRLHVIRERLDDPDHPYLVSIILDGENCWESYPDYGDPFLHHLYQRLAEEEAIQTVTVSEHLEQYPPRQGISRLATGSWIGGNLETWIGEAEQNQAWETLAKVRRELVAWQNATAGASLDVLAEAWRQIYIAEGSDWFWWYGEDHAAVGGAEFDALFRKHVRRVYELLDATPPDVLQETVVPQPTCEPWEQAARFPD